MKNRKEWLFCEPEVPEQDEDNEPVEPTPKTIPDPDRPS